MIEVIQNGKDLVKAISDILMDCMCCGVCCSFKLKITTFHMSLKIMSRVTICTFLVSDDLKFKGIQQNKPICGMCDVGYGDAKRYKISNENKVLYRFNDKISI